MNPGASADGGPPERGGGSPGASPDRPGDGSGEAETPAPSKSPASPSILVADGPSSAATIESWLEGLLPVTATSSLGEATGVLDRDVCVAILGAGVSTASKESLLEPLSMRSPYARTALVPSGDQPPMIESPGYDKILYRPLEREELRSVVKHLARVSVYERTVSTYFEYTTLAANYEVGDDAVDDEDYDRLQSHIDRLEARLKRIRASLDEADRKLLYESLEDDALPTFTEDVRRSDGKRRPSGCSNCGLDWEAQHGGNLGEGYERLGAFVYKCTNCGTVQEAPDPSHRRVA